MLHGTAGGAAAGAAAGDAGLLPVAVVGVADAGGGPDGLEVTVCAGPAVTVTVACGAADSPWVEHALVSRAMAAKATGTAVRRACLGIPR